MPEIVAPHDSHAIGLSVPPQLSTFDILLVFGAITTTNAGGRGGGGGSNSGGGLRFNFYKFTRCPQAEKLVRNITRSKVQNDPTLAAKLLRVHYHDCFVRVRPLFLGLHAMHAITYPPRH
ncbi:hypothetical protein ACH5RR_033417 [Cinchona calisaya]|uniref:peroxidase n=1 Tax=Cinchona calisaya TaxID=153742 RepID=A0ABD2YPG6_9GENT